MTYLTHAHYPEVLAMEVHGVVCSECIPLINDDQLYHRAQLDTEHVDTLAVLLSTVAVVKLCHRVVTHAILKKTIKVVSQLV